METPQVHKIEVMFSVGNTKVKYITCGIFETVTDETLVDRFVRDHKIGSKQGKVSVLSKVKLEKLGLNGTE